MIHKIKEKEDWQRMIHLYQKKKMKERHRNEIIYIVNIYKRMKKFFTFNFIIYT